MLSRSALRTASVLRSASASAAPKFAAPMGARTVTNLSKHVYTAHARAEGAGRNGLTSLVGEGGGLEVKLGMPRELGGDGKGNNPEQLFGLGYSACFLSALQLVCRGEKVKLPEDTTVDALVHIGPPEGSEGFAVAVDLTVKSSLDDKSKLKSLVDKAHEVCPYSKATRNNIPVTLKVE